MGGWKMDEIVKYNNQMNKLSFSGFTKTHMDFFMAICSKVKNQGTDEIHIKTHELKEIARFEKGGGRDFFEELDAMTDQLQHMNGKIVDRTPGHRKFVKFTLFPTFECDEDGEWLTVKVNDRFAHLLNEFENYTTFELAEFIELKSKYSKNLYRQLKQWRTIGKYVFHDLEEFRRLMDIPVSYTNKLMMQKCVNPAIEEISALDKSFKNFKCEPKYARKRGKPLNELVFTWKPERNTRPEEITIEMIPGQLTIEDYPEYMPPDTKTAAAADQQHDDDIQKIVQLMAAKQISPLNAKKIYDSAQGDLQHIGEVYQYFKDKQADNFVGLMIKMVRPGEWEKPKRNAKKTGFHNFTERTYDYDDLERKLLDASMKRGAENDD